MNYFHHIFSSIHCTPWARVAIKIVTGQTSGEEVCGRRVPEVESSRQRVGHLDVVPRPWVTIPGEEHRI